MNTAQLLDFHTLLCTQARELMQRKNHDYAGKKGDEPFANFTRVEALGITTTERGMLVRMTDKLSRLATFCDAGRLLVEEEKIEDTLVDIVNYAILFGALLASKRQEVADRTQRELLKSTDFVSSSSGQTSNHPGNCDCSRCRPGSIL